MVIVLLSIIFLDPLSFSPFASLAASAKKAKEIAPSPWGKVGKGVEATEGADY